MKIAVNTRFLIQNRLEGIGWYSFEVLRRLVHQHPEHEFIFFFDRPFSSEFIFGPNVQAEVLFPPARHATLWYWWFEWTLPRALTRHNVDVFLSPDGFLSLNSKVKTIMVTHDIAHVHFPEQIPFHGRVFYQYFVPKYLRHAAKVVAVSDFTRQDIIRQYRIPEDKIAVAYNGCREEFQPLSDAVKMQIRQQYAAGQEYFFYLGAVHPRKNVHLLIEAFDLFKRKTNAPVKLLIGGRFAWQTGVVNTAYEKAQHQSDIVFLGYIEEESLPLLMGAATALTYLSLFEGFGVPLLEAMHCEVPIIASNVTAIPEVVGPAALLVDPNDAEKISIKMKNLYEDKALQQHLIEEGQRQRRQFSWDKTTHTIYQAILEVTQAS